jgi:hypothetical protein
VPTQKRSRAQNLSRHELQLAGSAYRNHRYATYDFINRHNNLPKTKNGWTSKHLSTCCPKAFIAVIEKSISGILLLEPPKVRFKCYFSRTVSLTEESVTAGNDLPPRTTQSTELKFAIQHIDAAISNVTQYDAHQADPLHVLRGTPYTAMKRKG